jgi:hypothetical protein
LTCVAIKDDFVQVVIFHAELLSQLLAWRLKLRPYDVSAKVKEVSFYSHLLFFVVPFVLVFLAVDFFVSAEGIVCRAAGFGLDSAGVAAGFGFDAPFLAGAGSDGEAASATGEVASVGRGASC